MFERIKLEIKRFKAKRLNKKRPWMVESFVKALNDLDIAKRTFWLKYEPLEEYYPSKVNLTLKECNLTLGANVEIKVRRVVKYEKFWIFSVGVYIPTALGEKKEPNAGRYITQIIYEHDIPRLLKIADGWTGLDTSETNMLLKSVIAQIAEKK